MKCIQCSDRTEVESTQALTRRTKRVRRCTACGHRFATIETLLPPLKKQAPDRCAPTAPSIGAHLSGVWR